MVGELFLDVAPGPGLLEEHVFQQVRHAGLPIALVTRADEVGHVDRYLRLRLVGKQKDAKAVRQGIFGDSLDRSDLSDALRQLLGEGRERDERENGGKLGETQRTTHRWFD